jgi:transcriptional regulator with XRE-family HTH domain
MQTLSNNLKKLRTNAGISMQQLARAIDVPKGRYEHWENRNIEPPLDKLIALANFYNITVDELLNTKKPKSIPTLQQKFSSAPLHIQNAVTILLKVK